MDADQCRVRAAECAANALVAADEQVSQEFLKLAAQWRAMAVRTIVLGSPDEAATGPPPGSPVAPLPGPLDPKALDSD
jgi:hypothetical protein